MPRVKLFGFELDALRMPEAVAQVLTWTTNREGRCRYVVTPNVDHTVMFAERAELRQAYADASLVLADGMPVLLAAKLLRRGVPERVPGSDLAPALFAEASRRCAKPASATVGAKIDDGQVENLSHEATSAAASLRVFLLGAGPGVAERAARNIIARWPGVAIVGTYSPPLGFEHDAAENRRILDQIAAARADLLVVGLGAPKQELWVHAHQHEIAASVALCVGATIDFLAGEKARAPKWMRRVGLEWCHRLATEPRRLARRYARDAWLFPRLVWREWRAG